MSVTIKISWNTRTIHIKGYDEHKELVYSESKTAATKKEFRSLVASKLDEYGEFTASVGA